jgi:hypothetical protein
LNSLIGVNQQQDRSPNQSVLAKNHRIDHLIFQNQRNSRSVERFLPTESNTTSHASLLTIEPRLQPVKLSTLDESGDLKPGAPRQLEFFIHRNGKLKSLPTYKSRDAEANSRMSYMKARL